MNKKQIAKRLQTRESIALFDKARPTSVPDAEFEALYREELVLNGTRLCRYKDNRQFTLRRVSYAYVTEYYRRKHEMDVLLGLAKPGPLLSSNCDG